MNNLKSIRALDSVPGFGASAKMPGVFEDQRPRHPAPALKKAAIRSHRSWVRHSSIADWRIYLTFERWRVACATYRGVQVKQLAWLRRTGAIPDAVILVAKAARRHA